jgi:hypothetical protein
MTMSILRGLKVACLLDRACSSLGISNDDLRQRRQQHPVWQLINEADQIQTESLARLRARNLVQIRQDAALMEKLYPGYRRIEPATCPRGAATHLITALSKQKG